MSERMLDKMPDFEEVIAGSVIAGSDPTINPAPHYQVQTPLDQWHSREF
jgi:hypothetical protein